jgi:leucyl/phenylalanyl-tRNA---protein transferase
MRLPYWIKTAALEFPPVDRALREPNGLLAVGGDLRPERLLEAYRRGIFPWYSQGQPILWWSPDPRAVLFPERIKVSRSLRKTLHKGVYAVTLDTAFEQVLEGCAAPRREGAGTWITREMKDAYSRLHRLGFAHSVECWTQGRLVGGLYGVAVRRIFAGESMFSMEPDASKVALVTLARKLEAWGYRLIDCQVYSEHLGRLGAENLPRREFLRLLNEWGEPSVQSVAWRLEGSSHAGPA